MIHEMFCCCSTFQDLKSVDITLLLLILNCLSELLFKNVYSKNRQATQNSTGLGASLKLRMMTGRFR
jgi:hypothetical protein